MTTIQSNIDLRLQQISYSARQLLLRCPRKFQLDRLNSLSEDTDKDGKGNLTFAFGHVVGDGIQKIFNGDSLESVIWDMFLGWHADLLEENEKQKKSFWLAVYAIQKIASMREDGFFSDYEVFQYNGKPACELTFKVTLPGGFAYRGAVDAVLINKYTKEILVLEAKTSSAYEINPLQYKNSFQAVGYSVVLDQICPDYSSYKVLYLVYKTKSQEYVYFEFIKQAYQRAVWLQELSLTCRTIELYDDTGVYPTNGDNCISFGRDCQYNNLCHLSTSSLITPLTDEYVQSVQDIKYDVEVTFQELINSQLAKC